jgi:ribosomal protein S18 acetylase RimI-like enzyme
MNSLQILAMAAAAVQQSDSLQYAPAFTIRQPRSSDIPVLAQVERSAAEIFRTVNLDFLVENPTVDPYLLVAMANANHLWIAVDKFDQPIGFVGGEYLDGNFHIVEISVAKNFQGMGVGKALMKVLVEQTRREGYKAMTLTTYRNLPWNAPWYSKMGFFEVNAQEMGKTFEDILEIEAKHGLDINNRCVMVKAL